MTTHRTPITAVEVIFPTLVLILIAIGAALQPEPNAFLAIAAATLAFLPFIIAMLHEIGNELWAISKVRRKGNLSPLRNDFGKTLLDFIPILILVGIGVLLEVFVTNALQDKVYAIQPSDIPKPVIGCTTQRFVCRVEKSDFFQNLEVTIERLEPKLTVTIKEAVENASKQARGDPAGVRALPAMLFDGVPTRKVAPVFPRELFKLPEWCGPWRWITRTGECMKRRILKSSNQAWTKLRLEMQTRLERTIMKEGMTREAALNDLDAFANVQISRSVALAGQQARIAIKRTDVMISLLDIYLWATLLLALTKLFLIILGRRIYDVSSTELGMCLSSSPPSTVNAIEARDVTRSGGVGGFEYAFTPTTDNAVHLEAIYVRYSKGVLQGAIGDGWPHPLGAGIRRLMSCALILYRFVPSARRQKVTIGTEHDLRCVQFKLEVGDRIAFDFADLLAVSDGIRFRTVLSLRFAAFLRCRNFYSVAEGQGYIILRASGGVTRLRPDEDDVASARSGSLPINHLGYDFDGVYCSNALGDEEYGSGQWHKWKRLFVQSGNVFQGGPISPLGPTRLIEHAAPDGFGKKVNVVRRLLFFVLPV